MHAYARIHTQCIFTSIFQVQYVRLISTPSTGTTNVVTVNKSKSATTLQTVGISQKVGNQQQIVKVLRLILRLRI